MNSNESHIAVVVTFITNYRQMERASYEEGFQLIRKARAHDPDDNITEHLCRHWKGKKKDFTSFYLNLGYHNQIRFLHLWGIHDPEDTTYLAKSVDPINFLFIKPPPTAYTLARMLIYFNNHGIEPCEPSSTEPGLKLTKLPPAGKRYGNSKNWGNYILSLKDREEVLEQIIPNSYTSSSTS